MTNQTGLRIMTAEGPVRGSRDGDLWVFRGIPYAAPPQGALRWRPPQPVTPWQQERAATTFGASSWQNAADCQAAGGGDPGELSEDCLYLNVWTPDAAAGTPLPVMVWLHGGGFVLGAGGLPPYHGQPLASRGAVVVTINYRLGHLGFFSHPSLDTGYPAGDTVNNFGLLDQIAALQWVQRNILAFGGDPGNVTLMGESSGARSVLSLCCSPRAEGLFHKGIVQSAYSLPDTPQATARQQGIAVARHLGLPPDASAAALRALPADVFWSLTGALAVPPVPIAGDSVLPEPMLETFRAAKQHRLPLMAGSNSDEASVLVYFGVDTRRVIQQLRARNWFTWRLLRTIYRLDDDTLLGRAVARDMAFTLVPRLVMQAQHAVGMPGWRYWFDYVSEQARDLYPQGTWHGNEVPYVLNTLTHLPESGDARPFTPADRAFAAQVSEYWFTFARDAGRNQSPLSGVIDWPAWQPDADVTLSLGEARQGRVTLKRNFMRRRLSLYRLLMTKMVQLKGAGDN